MPEISQPSLTSGEASPSIYGRVDIARYYTSLRTCLNWIIKATGGAINRPGFMFCASTKYHAKKSRLIEFRFSASQAYALEFGDYIMRIYYRGGLVVYPVGHAQAGQVVEVTTVYPESALALLDFTQSSDVMTLCHADYPQQQLSRADHHLWSIAPFLNVNGPFGDMNIDVTKTLQASWYTGNITLTAAVSIFTADMVGMLMRIERSAESMTRQWEVSAVMAGGEIRRTNTGYYQAVSAGTTGTVRPDHLEGLAYDGDPGVSWQFLHAGFGIVLLTGYTSGTVMTGTVLSRLPEQVVTGAIGQTITGLVPGAPEIPAEAIPAVKTRITVPIHGLLNGQSATISGVTQPAGVNGAWNVQVIDLNTFDVASYDNTAWTNDGVVTVSLVAQPTYKWALELWGGVNGYPSSSTYYQQRQVFGGTKGKPNGVQMSKSAGFTDFGTSNPLLDDDAIIVALNAGSIGSITHFVNLKQLIALTSEGPWLIDKKQGEPIPTTDPQGEGGASTVRPLKINKQALYVEDKGGAIRSLGYEFSSDSYEGKDLTVAADHLFENHEILEWAYQKIPFHCVWMVRDDGVLLGLTYMIEQEVVGWHRHTTDGFFESVCCVSEDSEDVVYVVVRRIIGGVTKRYVERLASRKFNSIRDEFFVDSGLSYDGRGLGDAVEWTLTGGADWTYQETLTFTTDIDFFSGASDVGDAMVLLDATGKLINLRIIEYVTPKIVKVLPSRTVPEEFRGIAQTGFDMARDTFSGLGHLEGKTVSILASGNVAPQVVVTGGVVTIPNAATVVHIGLPIVADIETLDINVQGQVLQDRVKNINSVSLMVKNTRGLAAGQNERRLYDARSELSGSFDEFYTQTTGMETINIASDWSKGGRVLIRQELPVAAEILSIIPNVQVSGS